MRFADSLYKTNIALQPIELTSQKPTVAQKCFPVFVPNPFPRPSSGSAIPLLRPQDKCLLFVLLLEKDAQNVGLELIFSLNGAMLLPKNHTFALQRSCFQRQFIPTLSVGSAGAQQQHLETLDST
jgi:hypothetical protein